MAKEKLTAAQAAELLTAVRAERSARLAARRAAADYKPRLVFVGAGEDYDLVLEHHKRTHPEEIAEGYDFEVVSSFIDKPRPELCTPASRAQADARRAELTARDERSRRNAAEKLEGTPWRDRYAAPADDPAPELQQTDSFDQPI